MVSRVIGIRPRRFEPTDIGQVGHRTRIVEAFDESGEVSANQLGTDRELCREHADQTDMDIVAIDGEAQRIDFPLQEMTPRGTG
ncbi:MAG: hypothetical protein MO852_01065 [Candidatus Devosia euplotis]|nr:hypothetical protein [Candidatus Devosia euplotis]